MLYTTYLSKLKAIKRNAGIKYIIMRVPPTLDLKGLGNAVLMPKLSPSLGLLYKIKNKEITREKFTERLITEIYLNDTVEDTFLEIIQKLLIGEDVFLVCCEKDFTVCHRSVVAQMICDVDPTLNLKWKEWE